SLVMEVTETSLIDRLDDAEALLAQLRHHGFQIALDDFGTGYSSLAYLHKLPLDMVKRDQSLVKDLPEQRPIAIVKFVTQLVKSLGAQVVGEGVETSVHRACLSGLGCDYGQGYLFGKPLERDAWLAYCREHRSPVSE
ncbi:MAG: EAL domain-containing protein, partial [Myxococcota bacterium]|nr:EAL domain-containing protein [Myxococcota bacterium]